MTPVDSEREGQLSGELIGILKRQSFRDPFFADVLSGRMSRAGIKVWTLQASLVVKQFTRFISAIHSNCPHRDAQQLLAENPWEEHGSGDGAADHYRLIRRLAISLGADEAGLDDVRQLPETAAHIDHCLIVTPELTFVESLASVVAGIEYFMPIFFGGLAQALQSHYGLSSADVEYLRVHVQDDAEHSRRSLDLIDRYADTDESRERVKAAVEETLRV